MRHEGHKTTSQLSKLIRRKSQNEGTKLQTSQEKRKVQRCMNESHLYAIDNMNLLTFGAEIEIHLSRVKLP